MAEMDVMDNGDHKDPKEIKATPAKMAKMELPVRPDHPVQPDHKGQRGHKDRPVATEPTGHPVPKENKGPLDKVSPPMGQSDKY